eukprot:TRINITY_DN67651_c1_g1_i1.p1 TRINITY_DN67651_c1_g1~~TRINITY_DN67651_c1_g1_i1.p1  ORF type:complete len:1211 (+),score=162.13 TRINITY_DN67651_c1_g1_i1:108-3635(+)
MQEIVVGRGMWLELLKPDENGHIVTVASQQIFGVVRSVMPFRLTGTTRDYIVVGSDSGRICILEFDGPTKKFKRVHMETYGKSGCRRVVPGQYLATDPRGRAIMISAVEKQKFVYILNRDSSNNLTISSPLEAHKSHSIVYSVCGVDVGFENPVFATIEVDYSELDEDPEAPQPEKMLVYYELDLGLNHVLRKWSCPVEPTANMLIPVPGGNDGPSGVLVCSENYISYKHSTQSSDDEKADSSRGVIPRRHDMSHDQGLLIVNYAAHKQKDMFFFLVQSEYGDLYKVTLDWLGETVRVIVKYFDTIQCSNGLVVLRAGFLFSAAEFSNHKLYQFQGIGDDDDDAIIGYMTIGEENTPEDEQEVLPLFKPRLLKNLLLIDDIDSLSPICDCKVMDLFQQDKSQLYTLCGRGPQSTLRILRHGLSVTELAFSELPGVPNAVWTVKRRFTDPYDEYIVVTFMNATLVLSIGETVEEVTDSGFSGSITTLLCTTLMDNSMLQVHPGGIRHIRRDGRINEWKSTGKRAISRAASNEKQVVIAQGSEIVYFELDISGSLVDVAKVDLGQDITCVDVGPIQAGRQRCKFVSVGFPDKTVRIYNVESEMQVPLSRLICSVEPESIALLNMPSETGEVQDTTYLFVGLRNGMLQRCTVDAMTGEIRDPRTRLCGARPCRLIKVRTQGSNSVLVLSSSTWLCYHANSKFNITPMGDDSFEYAASFASEPCPEGLVTIQSNKVRILSVDRIGDSIFHQQSVQLKCTPRRFITHPSTNYLIMLETDHRTYTNQEKEEIKQELKSSTAADDNDDMEEEDLPEREYGTIKAPEGTWASYIRIYDPVQQVTHDMIELEDNQAAISLCTCVFHDRGSEVFLIVGTVKDMKLTPKVDKGGVLLAFKFTDLGRKLELVHKTTLEAAPYALCAYQGRLLVGVGTALRIYDMGKRKLLRKCENKNFANMIVSIQKIGDRIYVGDVTDGIIFVKYQRKENQLVAFADTPSPYWVTAMLPIDHSTVIVADKFGNVTVQRLAPTITDDIDADNQKNWIWDRGLTNGAPQKSTEIVKYHVGDVVTSLTKAPLTTGGQEVIVYTTFMGSIGCFVPMQTRDDADFFTLLEMHLHQENPPLLGREHQVFRGAYHPVKDCIDGDFCELFTTLPYKKQQEIAEELDRTPEEVCKRLEDIRNKVL